MTFSDRKWRLSSGTTRSYRKTAFLSEYCCGIHWEKKNNGGCGLPTCFYTILMPILITDRLSELPSSAR